VGNGGVVTEDGRLLCLKCDGIEKKPPRTPAETPPESAEHPWYCSVEGQTYGGYGTDALVTFIVSGRLKPDVLVWKTGLPGWVTANCIPEIAVGIPNSIANPKPPVSQQAPKSVSAAVVEAGGNQDSGTSTFPAICAWCGNKFTASEEHLKVKTAICPHCDLINELRLNPNATVSTFCSSFKWTLPKIWALLSLGPAAIVGLCYLDRHPPEEALVMFLSNVIGWGLVSGIGCLIYKGLKS
jgi:hypothetical protein